MAVGRILGLLDLGSSKTLSPLKTLPRQTWSPLPSQRDQVSVSRQGWGVKFNQVKFSYPARANRQVLKGLDIEVHPGQFGALVGPSGAGKSTIIFLLERLYHIKSGDITIDGQDITAKKEPVFRDDIGLVP